MHRLPLEISRWAVGLLIAMSLFHIAAVAAHALGKCPDKQAWFCFSGRMDVK